MHQMCAIFLHPTRCSKHTFSAPVIILHILTESLSSFFFRKMNSMKILEKKLKFFHRASMMEWIEKCVIAKTKKRKDRGGQEDSISALIFGRRHFKEPKSSKCDFYCPCGTAKLTFLSLARFHLLSRTIPWQINVPQSENFIESFGFNDILLLTFFWLLLETSPRLACMTGF